MKNIYLMAAIAAVVAPSAPLLAQSNPVQGEQRRDGDARAADREDRKDQREQARGLAKADRDARHANRGWRGYANYDWDRREPGRDRYDAGRYYRSGNYYQTRTLASNDRVYRGQNGRYYCRRADGTTGLIIGAAAGGLLGNIIGRGDSQVLGTLIGAAGGGLAGRAIERGNVRCR